jgi:hypothetical protein
MLGDLRDAGKIVPVMPSEPEMPAQVVDSIGREDLVKAAGVYGDPEWGEPIEYDHLIIEHDAGTAEITVYNRGIMLLFAASEIIRRIHRVCCVIEDADNKPR